MATSTRSSTSSQSIHIPEWTLERVKLAVSRGSKIHPSAVDIGNGLLVKYGTRVNSREADATMLVAAHTSVPVAEIHAILHDEVESVTYIVQSKLPGCSLSLLLPTLQPDQQATIELELKEILRELSLLDTYGQMGMVGKPSQFLGFHPFEVHGPWEATNLLEFLTWPINKANSAFGCTVIEPIDFGNFDLQKPPIFSHGDLVPENILIHDGHVSGIIDWEHAGWYPYFWNAYIAQRNWHRYPKIWLDMVPNIMIPYRRDWIVFRHDIFGKANRYL
ncbi:hypothetical protein H2248_012136 [Termitomyces sp. 'cryptogamus']|nr:hypothetical protein H2248_012136 [Termitomyces sp. 'cryptogamus']